MQNTNRNTKYKMPCHVPQAQIKKEVLKDKLQIKNPKHKYGPACHRLSRSLFIKGTKSIYLSL